MEKFIALVPLFPLIGFLINGFFGDKLSKGLSGTIASIAILMSFVVSVALFFAAKSHPETPITIDLFSWISAGQLSVPFALMVDPLSSIFILIITGIGFLIHIYSMGYMHDDEGHNRFFAYLNLFVFFMLLLVLGSNYLIMFVGWEGVGLCSYLLIGFWFKNTAYNHAAKKAFIINRIGDLGFLLGIMLIYFQFNSISYDTVFNTAHTASEGTITCIAICLFIGAMGKSAQIPLYTWLPDAMAGPTPVSALIHAATMVTAGIYMIVRSNVFYAISQDASTFVAVIGGITALMAASIGILQNDIKKILAYSTVSQLGLMFLALGVGAYSTAVFHVTTHAFFKALLFLGAGSVIHAMSGEQDIRKMGGLKGSMKITHFTMLMGTIAISGIFPFSGFFSKDEILVHAYEKSTCLWVIASLTSVLTAFYMFRMYYLTFHGSFRGTAEQKHHLHESPGTMTFPLIVLAILSVVGGLIGLPEVFGFKNRIGDYLDHIIERPNPLLMAHSTEYALMATALILAILSIFFAYQKYIKKGELPANDEKELGSFARLVYHKYKVDELYSAVITRPLNLISSALHTFFEAKIIDGFVEGIATTAIGAGSLIRKLQQGNIGFYIVAMVLGVIILLFSTLL